MILIVLFWVLQHLGAPWWVWLCAVASVVRVIYR